MRIVGRFDALVREKIYANGGLMEFLLLSLLIYNMLDAVIIVWFTLTPLMAQSDNRLFFGLSMLAYNVGYLTSNCHQMPQRSIMIDGFQIPFCSRDWAIYVGCLIGGVLPFLKMRKPKWLASFYALILFTVPMAVDGVTQTIFKWRESSNEMRVLTGILFGFGCAYFLAARIVENSRRFTDFREQTIKVARMAAATIAILLVWGYFYGAEYKTMNQAIHESELKPDFVTYVTKRALVMIHYDPYILTYTDPVMERLLNHRPVTEGVWVIYQGKMTKEGKYVYFSRGDGRIALISDKSQ